MITATSETLDLLVNYPWPGNVRELRNAIERAVLLTDHELLTLQDLPVEIRSAARADVVAASEPGRAFELPEGGVVLDDVERHLVAQALDRAGGNRTRAARLLGMNRDQIRYRIEKYRLESPSRGGSNGGEAD